MGCLACRDMDFNRFGLSDPVIAKHESASGWERSSAEWRLRVSQGPLSPPPRAITIFLYD